MIGRWWKKFLQRRAQRRAQSQLGDAVALLANALRAGLTLERAVDFVAEHGPAPIAEHFARIRQDVRMGASLTDAFAQLSQRVGGEEAALLRYAVAVLFDAGGNLIALFDGVNHAVHERLRVQGKIRTFVTQGVASGVIIICLPLLLLAIMSLMMPQIVTPLFTTLPGFVIFGLAVTLQIAGLCWMKKIVQVPI